MIKDRAERGSTLQISPPILNLDVASNACLFVAGLIATTILCGWVIPPVSRLLPDGWSAMQATSALCTIFLGSALAWSKQGNRRRRASVSRIFAILSLVLVGVTLLEHQYDREAILGTYLVAEEHLALVYPTSLQSAACFLMLALTIFIDPSRQSKSGRVFEVLIFILVLLNLLFLAGYLYRAVSLIRVTSAIYISLQSLLCIALLTFVQAARRSPFGSYAVLLSRGIAGHTARIVLPFSVIISYLIILSQTELTRANLLGAPLAAATTAVASAAIMIVVVLVLSNNIDKLEQRLHAMSITDELTGAYNLRGLNLQGKQRLLDAKRSGTQLSILYIDIDNLKQVNDSLGHDAGSSLLCDVVSLLHDTFRRSDIVARVGGDEFVIVAHDSESQLDAAARRFNMAVHDLNLSGNRPYKIEFSIGNAVFDPRGSESLEDLISRADEAMYRKKAGKGRQAS